MRKPIRNQNRHFALKKEEAETTRRKCIMQQKAEKNGTRTEIDKK